MCFTSKRPQVDLQELQQQMIVVILIYSEKLAGV